MKNINTYIIEKFKISSKANLVPYSKGDTLVILELSGEDNESYIKILETRLVTYELSNHVQIGYKDSVKGDLLKDAFINDKGYCEIDEDVDSFPDPKHHTIVFLPVKEGIEVLTKLTLDSISSAEIKKVLLKFFDSNDTKKINSAPIMVMTYKRQMKKMIEKIKP